MPLTVSELKALSLGEMVRDGAFISHRDRVRVSSQVEIASTAQACFSSAGRKT